jgi:uncharacterized membrane protein HdeD (DUF308 family)
MTSTTIEKTSLRQKHSFWWLLLLQGLSGLILGAMLLTEPAATLIAITTLLGFYWLVMGVLNLVQVFVDRATPWIWSLLAGLVGILAGLFVLQHPLIAALTVPALIVIVLGLQGVLMGLFEILGGIRGGGAGAFVRGLIHILIGALLLSSPLLAALAVPFVFGALLMIQGVCLLVLALVAVMRGEPAR